MHLLQSLTCALLSSLLASILNSHPASSAALRRRSDDLNFPLLGPDGCANFELDNSNFKAICVDDTGEPVISSVNMDQCILNQGGNLAFLVNGGFSGSCSGCTLDDNLNLTCNCQTGVANDIIKSTINIDGTTSDSGSGAFVQDNGYLSCRAPTG